MPDDMHADTTKLGKIFAPLDWSSGRAFRGHGLFVPHGNVPPGAGELYLREDGRRLPKVGLRLRVIGVAMDQCPSRARPILPSSRRI